MNKEISVKVGDLCKFFIYNCIILSTAKVNIYNNINTSKAYYIIETCKLSKTALLIFESQHLIASYNVK